MNRTAMRRRGGRRSFVALAVGMPALFGSDATRPASAEIVFDPNLVFPSDASLRLSAFAFGGGSGRDDADVVVEAPRGFTSFTASPAPQGASHSGTNGAAFGRAGGSATSTISLLNDVLSVRALVSFDTEGRFTRASNPVDNRGGGNGSGTFSSSVSFLLTEQAYEYSLSGRVVHAITGDPGGSQRSRGRIRLFGAGVNFSFDDDHRSGSGTVNPADTGVLRAGNYSFDLDYDAFSGAGPASTASRGTSVGSFDAQLTLRPVTRWDNPAGGSFRVATNWIGDRVPAPEHVAFFDLPGTYTVTLDRDISNHALRFSGDGVNVTLDLGDNRYTVGEMSVGNAPGENVKVTVTGSGGPVGIAAVTAQAGERGSIPVAGAQRINGIYELIEGATETVADRVIVDGRMVVRDAGTIAEIEALSIGTQPAAVSGLVGVSNGGKLVTRSFAALGENAGGVGVVAGNVVVADAGSVWEHRGEQLTIGAGGRGSLQILGGGKFTTTDGVVNLATGSGSKGTLEVAGAGSAFTAKTLKVGDFGQGDALARVGGRIELSNLEVVGSAGAPSTLTVAGAGSSLGVLAQTSIKGAIGGTGTLTIGTGAFALLEATNVGFGGELTVRSGTPNGFAMDALVVESGGQFNVRDGTGGGARDVKVGGAGGAQSLALVEGTGSTLRVAEILTVASGGTVTARGGGLVQVDDTLEVLVGGALRVEPGGMVNLGVGVGIPNRLRIGPGGTLSGGGQVLAAGVVRSGGIVSIGNSPGMLTLIGNYEEEAGAGGVLDIEIGGTTPVTSYDVLRVEGDASLAGDLLLTFIDGFAPRAGDAFEFLDLTGTLSGSFAGVEVRNLAPGFEFDLRRDAGGMTLVARNDGVFVPEPGTAGLLLLAATFGLKRRRRAACSFA